MRREYTAKLYRLWDDGLKRVHTGTTLPRLHHPNEQAR